MAEKKQAKTTKKIASKERKDKKQTDVKAKVKPQKPTKGTAKKTSLKKVPEVQKEKVVEKQPEKIIPKKATPQDKMNDRIMSVLDGRYLPMGIIDELSDHIIRDGLEKKLNLITERTFADYSKNRIDPAEACGIVGAQSIGEPGTQ
ncbi:MAG: hypothetical protein V1769_07310, partial [Thermoplasmatota archaeon]